MPQSSISQNGSRVQAVSSMTDQNGEHSSWTGFVPGFPRKIPE